MQCEVRWSHETGGGLVKPYPQDVSKYGRGPIWKDKIMEDEARRERRRRQRQKMLNCCKKFAAFLFSHIGLAAMVVAYSIMGGFLFMALEAPYEAKEKIRIRGERDDAIERILNEASQMKLDDADVVGNFTAKVRTILLAYQAEVVSAVKDSGWDGNDDTDVRALQWSFAGALLYAVTVITTIGYGHVAPKTEWGRLVTILYALIGIPLTFLYLSNIGNFLANSFRLFYKKVCCDICCCQQCERKKKMQRLRLRRQREQLAAQRNMVLASPRQPLRYGTHDDTIPIPTPNQSEYYIEAEQLGLPGGDENLGFEDDVDSDEDVQADPGDSVADYDKENATLLGKGVSEDIRETDILDDDFMKYSDDVRETDILDDDLDPPSRKPSKKKATSPSSDIHVSSGILDKLGDARETDILDDSEDENNDDNDAYDDIDCNDEDTLPDGRLRNQGSSKKYRNSSRKTRWVKDRTKKSEKDKKDKKDKSKNADGTKEQSRSSKKDKDREGKKEKTLSNDKDLKRQGSTRAAGDASNPYTSHSRSDSKKGRGCAPETDKSTRSSSRRFLRKGSDKNKKRESSQAASNSSHRFLRKKSSRRRRKSSSISEDDEPSDEEGKIQNKPFHHSEESFVTAQGDSLSYVERLNSDVASNDDDVDGAEDGFHGGRMPKSAIAPDIGIDDDDDFAMELMEYGELGPGHARFADDPFEYEGHADDEKVTVPISICLIIIAGYIFAGAVLFTVWEDWDYLTGSYFCFITLSTIGFGDIVPGTDMKEWSSHSKLVSCSLWLAFGLSLLAMCFNLMQEEVKEKCKWLGKKLGLLKDENEA